MTLTSRLLGASALVFIGITSLHPAERLALAQEAAVTTGQAEVDRLFASLPEELTASYGAVSYDVATGMTRVTNLKLSDQSEGSVGVQIGELQIAGLNMDILEARLSGQLLDTDGLLVDHFQASDITLFGIEKFYAGAVEAYVQALPDALDEELTQGDEPEAEAQLTKLDFKIDRILIDDFMLRPFVLNKKEFEEGDEDAEAFTFLQTAAAFQRAIGAQSMSVDGLTFNLEMEEDGQPISVAYTVSSINVEDWQGGDFGRSVTGVTQFNMTAPLDAEDGDDLPFETMDMSGEYGRQTVEGIRLDKALGYLARGVMPPRTETDLMSLGIWTSESAAFSLFGEPFYTLGASSADMTGFHWLIPTRIDMKVQDLVYNIGPFMAQIAEADPDLASGEDYETMMDVLGVMEDYGLAAPNIDADITWRWDPEAGPAELAMAYGLDGYGTLTTDLNLISASFDEFAGLFDIEDEAAREDAFEAMAKQDLKFSGFSLALDDAGGLDKLFAMAIDIMNVVPSDETAAFANMEPDGLRTMVAGLLPLAALEASKIFPPAGDYVAAFSAYLTEGGSFRIAAQPAEPLSGKEIEKLPQMVSDPDALVELFGLSAVHTPEAQ